MNFTRGAVLCIRVEPSHARRTGAGQQPSWNVPLSFQRRPGSSWVKRMSRDTPVWPVRSRIGEGDCAFGHPFLADIRCDLRVGHGGRHAGSTSKGVGHSWD